MSIEKKVILVKDSEDCSLLSVLLVDENVNAKDIEAEAFAFYEKNSEECLSTGDYLGIMESKYNTVPVETIKI